MTFCERIAVLFISSLCWAGMCLHAQPAQLDFRQFNTDDGLPSSETYTIMEDRSGYLWIGTDNGVARFDGYEFEVFDADDGLEDMVTFGIEEDDKGRIWISTYSGRIYYFDNGRFHPFKYNEVILDIKRTKHLGVLIDITPDECLIISFKNAGFLKIDSTGTTDWLLDLNNGGYYLYESMEGGRLTTTPRPHGFFQNFNQEIGDSTKIFLLNRDKVSYLTSFWTENYGRERSHMSGVFRTASGREGVISNTYETLILNEDASIKHRYPIGPKHYNYFLPGPYPDTYWAFLERGGGLQYLDFRQGGGTPKISHQLFGRSLSSGLLDQNGGFWVTTLDAGVFYCPYPKQLVYLKADETQNNKAISLALTGSANFYVGYDDGSFFHYDDELPQLREVQEKELFAAEGLFDLYYDPVRSRVFTPFYSFDHPIPKGEKLSKATVTDYYYEGESLSFKQFNRLKKKNARKLYAASTSYLAIFDLDSGELTKLRSSKEDLPGSAHVFGLHPDGRKLAGTLLGIMELRDDGRLVPNNLGVPELSNRVVFINDLGNGELLFGTRGSGVIFMGRDTTYLIREQDGLASDMIRDIHLSEKGVIWISTLNGLSRLDLAVDRNDYTVRTFRMGHGLPSNEVYQTDTYGEEVWLATSAGVVRFEEPRVVTQSSPPVIRKVVLNGEELPDTTAYAFPPGPQNVSISFGTINFVLGDELLYRYRFNEASPWQYSRERTVNYPNLGAGSYRFEIQSRNQDGYWSTGAVRNITVATPWYATIWAVLGGVLLIAVSLSSVFLLRERRRKREQELLFQITQLEHAALHAQMNPHFVFNALNSIQNFVLQNDARQAATYLSRFARVIRQTLRSSVDGRHNLEEELMMLETYLGLEKLRFKEGFTYTLDVDPALPVEDIVLPPLLIQPFVENAIIHGLKERKQGGKILVRFTGSVDNLIVVIEDNGKGIDPHEANKPESLGMEITRRRLNMMKRGQEEPSGMEIEPLLSPDGRALGTRVTLYILPLPSIAPAPAPKKT